MTEIYPIGGGKGGVGKSFLAANLGALIAKQGHNVVVIDLDLGASNLHTLLGVKRPKRGLNRYLDKTVRGLESVAFPTMIPGLFFISSLHCSMEIANLLHAHKLKIITAIQKLPFDYILLDLGTGTNFNTLDFFLTSKESILIGTPEPTSIENFFRFINAVYFRILKQTLKRSEFHSAVKDAVTEMSGATAGTHDILKIVSKYQPDKKTYLKNKLSEFKFKLILNQFRKNMDSTLGNKIETVCNRHFHSDFQFVGNIRYDEQIHDAVFSKTLYIHKYPHTQSSNDLKKIAEKITRNQRPTSLPKEIS
ncbi:MAG: P-loop NTPase [Deltaproteobacteria bacterium]|nr:P-loop NTPase [Deltaproteobacteria bacterium]